MARDQETRRKGGRLLRKAGFAARATGAAVLAAFASTAIVYGDDGDIALLPWWV